jgi:hypothetical protein
LTRLLALLAAAISLLVVVAYGGYAVTQTDVARVVEAVAVELFFAAMAVWSLRLVWP